MRDRYRPLAEAAPDDDAQAKVISDMLAELGASHTARYRQNDPAYYQLVDIFSRLAAAGRCATSIPTACRYPGIGLFTREIDGKLFVSPAPSQACPPRRLACWSATRSSTSTASRSQPVGSFEGKVGQTVTMHVRRTAGGDVPCRS